MVSHFKIGGVVIMNPKYMLFSILKYGFVTKQLFEKEDGIKFN